MKDRWGQSNRKHRAVFWPMLLLPLLFVVGCPPTDPVPVDDSPLVVSDGTPCGDACANMINCERPDDHSELMSECTDECVAEPTEATDLIACLGQATCEDFPSCFPLSCFDILDRTEECGEDSLVNDIFICDGLDTEHLECLETANCDALEDCLEGSARNQCQATCAKLDDCQRSMGSPDACLNYCLESNTADLNTCVSNTTCEEMDLCLVQPQVCYYSCSILKICEVVSEEGFEDCTTRCNAPWPETFTDCVQSAGCETIQDCGDLP